MKYLFLSGPRAVGKTYSANLLKNELPNTTMFDTGPTMRYYHRKLAPEMNIAQWVDELEKKYGPRITCYMLAKQLKDQMQRESSTNAIIVGFRELIGIKYLTEILKTEDFGVIYLDSSPQFLYDNYIERTFKNQDKRNDRILTKIEFEQFLQGEQDFGLSEIKDYSRRNNSYVFINDRDDETIIPKIKNYMNIGRLKNEGSGYEFNK